MTEIDRTPLIPFRDRLDVIDDQIMELFAQRYRVRDETMPVKLEHGMPIEVKSRVDEVVTRMLQKAKELNVPHDFALALYALIIEHSHKYEQGYRVSVGETADKKETVNV